MKYNYKDIKIEKNVKCRDLSVLHPVVLKKFEQFISESNSYLQSKGLQIFPVFTFRTAEQQEEVFRSGKSKARAGGSNHEFGLAVDFGVKSKTCGYLDASKNSSEVSLAIATYKEIWEKFGKNLGIEWGGNWKSFKDNPHFQYVKNTKGFNDKELRAYLKNGGDSDIIV